MSISKNDFLFFQNDILKDIKNLESTLNNKINQIAQTLSTKIGDHETKINRCSDNITELLSINASHKHDSQRIEELLKMRGTLNDSLLDCRTQINLVNRCVNNAISKYDTIIVENLALPGIVGMNCKFKNFRQYLEFIYKEIKATNAFKEQQVTNFKKYQEKLESLIKRIEAGLIEVTNKTSTICNTKFEQYEKIMEDKFNITQEFIQATRIDNSRCASELIEKTKELTFEHEKLKEIREELLNKFDTEMAKFKKEVDNNTKKFTANQNEFKILKQRFTQLGEFIRDIRFQKNIKQTDFRQMAKNIDFTKNQNFKDDSNIELYNEISNELKEFLGKYESPKRAKRKSIVIDNANKEQIKNKIMEKINKSPKSEKSPKRLTSPNIAAKKSKFNPTKRKRNSIAFQPNVFSKFQKKMYEEQNTSIKKEKRKRNSYMSQNSPAKNGAKKDMKINIEKNEILNKKTPPPSPSSSSSSSSSSLNSDNSSENSKNKKKESKKMLNDQDKDYKHIRIKAKKSNKNNIDKNSNKNVSRNESEIKAIKEEYGNKARLMSVDFMANTINKNRWSNKELLQMNNDYNTIIQMTEKQQLPYKTIQNFNSNSYRNNLSITSINNNNFMINKQFNKRINYNLDSNKIKNYQYKNNNNNNINTIFPPLSLKTARKNERILLLQNNFNININKKNNACLTDLNNKSLYKEQNINFDIKNEDIDDNDISIIRKHSIKLGENANIEGADYKNKDNNENDKAKTIKSFSCVLSVQNADKFNIIKKNVKKMVMNKINEIVIISKSNNKENNKKKSSESDEGLALIEREFEKEHNEKNFSMIKEKIEKINLNNETMTSRINSIEEKYTPVIGHMNEIFKIVTLIYDQIKNNQKINAQTNTNISRSEFNVSKIGGNMKNNILKEYKSKKGVRLIYPLKTENSVIIKETSKATNNSKDNKDNKDSNKYKLKINEENSGGSGGVGKNENDSIPPKDDINLLLKRIEPFLIKQFTK